MPVPVELVKQINKEVLIDPMLNPEQIICTFGLDKYSEEEKIKAKKYISLWNQKTQEKRL